MRRVKCFIWEHRKHERARLRKLTSISGVRCALSLTEIEPFIDEWEEAESFPRELYAKAADVGLLGIGFPEAYGGLDVDLLYSWVATEELCRAGSGGLLAGLLSHTIGAPPIAKIGSDALKKRFLPDILSGQKISCLAITEPGGGSDVANLKTTARREGEHYIVNGAKTFITSGMRADCITVAVRTGGPGLEGISLLMVEKDTPGLTRKPSKKWVGGVRIRRPSTLKIAPFPQKISLARKIKDSWASCSTLISNVFSWRDRPWALLRHASKKPFRGPKNAKPSESR